MPATAVTPLGPPTLVRKWRLDVNTGTHGAPTWIPVRGLSEFKPSVDPTKKDDSDLNSDGWGSESITKLAWGIDGKIWRKTGDTVTTYDAGQEVLRAASALLGILNTVEVRWYEMTSGGPKVEAYQGYASVEWKPDGGGMDDLDGVSVNLNGQGIRTAITHPDGAAAVPVLYSVTPAVGVQAGGTLHTLYGVGFFAAGVADVQSMLLAAEPITKFVVHSDGMLTFLAPAIAAGAKVVYVTNSVGKSITAVVTVTIT